MTAEDIRSLTRIRPFRPIRITLTNGEEFDVKHPELVWAWGGMVYLPRETARTPDPMEGTTVIAALSHVLKVEQLTDTAAPPVDRSTV